MQEEITTMNIIEIVFSPTGGTEKVANIIVSNWSKNVKRIDLSDPKIDFSKYEINKDDLVLIAMPSFGGRAPSVAIERLKYINGNGADCTIVCVYGNRAYEDTLVEMEDTAKQCGFRVTAAISAIAEHSIIHKYAANRPDESDEKQLADFAAKILDKSDEVTFIPGNRPYKKTSGAGLVPKPNKDCVKCGLCAEKCPVQAIEYDKFTADSKKCISCMRCVNQCPKSARKVNEAMVSIAAMAIRKACLNRKKNELFL